jgi:beta-phosphoglucomutase family hydrolase
MAYREASGNRDHLGLPVRIEACLFDLDGVLTRTASVHAAAWKQTFDTYLATRAESLHLPFAPFDAEADYRRHVDGRPRLDGVRAFLVARRILPAGEESPEQAALVESLAERKNALVRHLIATQGVEVFPGARRYVEAAREAGLRNAVVSSSANTSAVLDVTGLGPLFDLRMDAQLAEELGLAGKPAPDTFLAASELLGVRPSHAAVFEDAVPHAGPLPG